MKDLKVFFLKDFEDGGIDGVIVVDNVTMEDVQKAIDKVKDEVELYSYEDIEKALPNGCKLFWVDSENNDQIVYF